MCVVKQNQLLIYSNSQECCLCVFACMSVILAPTAPRPAANLLTLDKNIAFETSLIRTHTNKTNTQEDVCIDRTNGV